jgi:hypothetical protein
MAELKAVPVDFDAAQPWLLADVGVEHFGPEDAISSFQGEIELRLGDRPVARSLRSLYKLAKRKLPPEIGALKGETYLIAHAVGAAAKKGAGRVESLELRASFAGTGSTIDLVPNTSFKEFLTADLTFEAGLAADGYAKIPDEVGALAAEVVNLGAGAELRLATTASIVGKLRLSLVSPRVQAVGRSSSTSSWQLDKHDRPLVGDQALVQTIVVPKGQESITFTLQAFATVDPGFFSRKVPLQTKLVEVEVELA